VIQLLGERVMSNILSFILGME